jgi:cell division protein FtsI/penicillin-binding protein 2/cell division protein FtsW (lipid II flippase)
MNGKQAALFMTITRSSAADRAQSSNQPNRADYGGRNLELFLLLIITAVLGVGLWLVLSAQANGVPSQSTNLNEAKTPSDLFPVLQFYDDPQERIFAASTILAFLQNHEPLQSLSDLRAIRITLGQINKAGVSGNFKERFKKGIADNSLSLLTPAQLRQMRPIACIRDEARFHHLALIYSGIFFLGFFALHIAWRSRRFSGDQLLLPAVLFLSGLGFLMMLRLRDPLREALLFPDFAIGVGIGCILAYLASLQNYERSLLKRLVYIPLLFSFVLSLALILFGSGPGSSDAKVNLQLGPIQFQPVELIKLLLLFFLAGYFADHWEFLRQLKQAPATMPGLFRRLEIPKLRYALPLIVAVAIAIAFFFLEKDLGPALVMSLLFLILYSTARSRAAGALLSCAFLAAAVWIGYELQIPHTVAARLSMWLSPWDNYVRSGGDHLAQSLWSFSRGGFFGAGLGLGSPATVPAVHTDLILAAIGEELGFAGLICVWAAYAVLIHRALRISLRSSGAYSMFLGFAAALLIALQVAFISAGILGIVPLSGVVTPFINYGKSSAFSGFIILGILASLSRNTSGATENESFRKPVTILGVLLGLIGALIIGQAARVQIFQSDYFLGRGALIRQADGHRRYAYNPRILEAVSHITRGSIFDRNGLPLATSSASLLGSYRTQYSQLNVDPDQIIKSGGGRYYPFGALTFHFLGDLKTRLNWGAPNSMYVERDLNTALQGFDDHSTAVRVQDDPGGPQRFVFRRDFQEVVPLVRYRHRPDQKQVQAILTRDRDLHLSMDVRLQSRVASILEKYINKSGTHRGAAVVIDPQKGEVLAAVSYPFVDFANAKLAAEADEIPENSELSDSLLDRVRYGLYPPGSSFKLITAIAAMQSQPNLAGITYECKRLPDGRIGNYVRGWGKPIRDDVLDKEPHGKVDISRGLIHSCNAFFAQLGAYVVGSEKLLQTAEIFGIRVASPNTAAQLKDSLPQASYGQGQVVASPIQMARVAGAIADQGLVMPARFLTGEAPVSAKTVLPSNQASELSQYMRRVVTEGTGREAGGAQVAIAGKTGTAELRDKPAHAWFVGFAPYGSSGTKKIAFAVLIENGRYGGRIAAPAAAEIVNAAVELGLLRER